jgi:hypothetical protein
LKKIENKITFWPATCFKNLNNLVLNVNNHLDTDTRIIEVGVNSKKCDTQLKHRLKPLNDIGTFIESGYNPKRLHSAHGYHSPPEFETEHTACCRRVEG